MPKIRANYLTTDASGRIGAEFTGHISAAGVDLRTELDTVPDAQRRVRWLRESDGSVAAYISTFSRAVDPLAVGTEIWSTAPAGKQSSIEIRASQQPFTNTDEYGLRVNRDGTGHGIVTAFAPGGTSFTIARDGGKSDFIQIGGSPSVEAWKIWGFYSAAYNFPAGSGQTINVAVAANILSGSFIPITANLNGFASDRINMPTYAVVNPSTLAVTLSTDWAGGAPNGTIWFAVLTKA